MGHMPPQRVSFNHNTSASTTQHSGSFASDEIRNNWKCHPGFQQLCEIILIEEGPCITDFYGQAS
jgi:hypothetical protein